MPTPTLRKPKSLNPLVVYKTKQNIGWNAIIAKTGIVRQQIYSMSKKSPEAFLTVSLSTALRLRRGIGLDLMDWLDKYFPNKSRQ